MFVYFPGDYTQHQVRGRFAKKPTRTRLMRVAAALSTIAIAASMSTAATATAARAAGPVDTPAAAITGPTYVTTAPSTFINTNNQVSTSANSMGDQVAP
jgi:hypothetical protein